MRAGYLIALLDLTYFHRLAPSWPVSVYGEARLLGHLDPRAQAWLQESRLELLRLRRKLAQGPEGSTCGTPSALAYRSGLGFPPRGRRP